MKKEDAISRNVNIVRLKVDSHALTSAIRALNNCGIFDISISKEDNDLIVFYDELEPYKYVKTVGGTMDCKDCDEVPVSSRNGSCSGCTHY